MPPADSPPSSTALANWLANEERALEVEPAALARLVGLVEARTLTRDAGRQVLERLVGDEGAGCDVDAIVAAEGLAAVGGDDELGPVVAAALNAHPDVAEKLRAGDMKPIGVIVGYVMRETRGRADGGEVARIVREKLGT